MRADPATQKRAERLLERLTSVLVANGSPAPLGASDAEIEREEWRAGVDFPWDLRLWLSLCKGCELPDGQILLGAVSGPSIAACTTPEFRESGLLPILGDGCGNYHCFDTRHPMCPIVFIEMHDSDHESNYAAASGLWPFLSMLLEEQESGEEDFVNAWFERERAFAADPDLEKITGYEFGWSDQPRSEERRT